ncbi:MAG: hypothetical protein JWM98_2334 [Thermoleophilia bacterium]|nr:hypothetical protein [Thermoleophilia bacterium]
MNVGVGIGLGVLAAAGIGVAAAVLIGHHGGSSEGTATGAGVPLPPTGARLGVEHLVGRTPMQAFEAYFQLADINGDGAVDFSGPGPEQFASLGWQDTADWDVLYENVYREADRAGNDDGIAQLDEFRSHASALVYHQLDDNGPMDSMQAASFFRRSHQE